jgi:hypothetical protein
MNLELNQYQVMRLKRIGNQTNLSLCNRVQLPVPTCVYWQDFTLDAAKPAAATNTATKTATATKASNASRSNKRLLSDDTLVRNSTMRIIQKRYEDHPEVPENHRDYVV